MSKAKLDDADAALTARGFHFNEEADRWERRQIDGTLMCVSSEVGSIYPEKFVEELLEVAERDRTAGGCVPLDDRVLVRLHEAAETTEGGIVLPDVRRDKYPDRGTVLAVGPGRELESGVRSEMLVHVGDVVAITRNAGIPINLKGFKEGSLRMMSQKEIMAVIYE